MINQPVENNYLELVSSNNDVKHSQGIGILVDMAKQGKIDPWQIDILDVTNKYLAHICKMKSENLRLTGQTFLFASILIRLQSNVLEGVELSDFEDKPDEPVFDEDGFVAEYGSEDEVPTSNVISLDEVLQRRTSVRLNHNRIVTLKDLIRQLEFYEKLEKKQVLKDAHERAKERVRSYARLTPQQIVNLAHDEYITDCVLKLKANLEQIFEHEEKIELNDLAVLGMVSWCLDITFRSQRQDGGSEDLQNYED